MTFRALLALTVFASLPSGWAAAAETSCDVVTGASCFWGEGCDCDHDGYVRDSGKSHKYCHFEVCPLDQNDSDANALGKPSEFNADGDGWTTAYDCDDSDPCIDGACDSICVPVPGDLDADGVPIDQDCDDNDPCIDAICDNVCVPEIGDADGDGVPADQDCDDDDACIDATCTDLCAGPPEDTDGDGYATDTDCDDGNAHIFPGAGIACCACEILLDEAKVAQFECDAKPCPFGAYQPPTEEEPVDPPGDDPPGDDPPGDDPPGDDPPGDDPPGDDPTGDDPTGDDPPGDDPSGEGSAVDDDPAQGSGLVGQPWPDQAEAPANPTLARGGVLERDEPAPPGCGAANGSHGALAVIALWLIWLFGRRRSRALIAGVLVLASVWAVGSGCAAVRPWERGRLAQTPMIFDGCPYETQLEQHVFQYREASAGGFGGGGGGCGCN